MERPVVIAHRGASGEAPGNTVSAIRLALSQRAPMIELDIRQSRDKHLVVIHDRSLWRTARVRRQVQDLTLAELKQLDIGSWFHRSFAAERIPTLDEVVTLVGGQASLNLDLKVEPPDDMRAVGRLLDLLAGRMAPERLLISSRDPAVLRTVKRLSGELPVSLIATRFTIGKALELAKALQAVSVHVRRWRVRASHMAAAHRQGLKVYLYTVNTPWAVRRALHLGADGVFTDYPARCLTLLKGGDSACADRSPSDKITERRDHAWMSKRP